MAMSGKERQRKWQERQKSIGKKRVTLMMDKEALAVLDQEKARTGESFSSIVSRAVVKMHKKVSANDLAESDDGVDENVSDNKSVDMDSLTERIITLIGVVGLSEEEVAQRFIDEKIAPPFHGDAWCAETVKTLYTRSISY